MPMLRGCPATFSAARLLTTSAARASALALTRRPTLWEKRGGFGALRLMSTMARGDALAVLGLPDSASRVDVKQSFRELAKALHPDVIGSSSEPGSGGSTLTFVEVLAAYEMLMEEHDDIQRQSANRATAKTNAARGGGARGGGTGGARTARKPPQARAQWRVGEILCEQLLDEACTMDTFANVWGASTARTFCERPRERSLVDLHAAL